jgi:hypothetical protein
MSSPIASPNGTRSWRDIPQNVTPRAMSSEGRKRLALSVGNLVGLCLIIGAMGWGIFEFIGLWQHDRTRLTAPVKREPLREIALRTDGVLDQGWVKRTLNLAADATLMELDLPALKNRLLAGGQVRSAVLARRFPDVLVITLQERTPVVRVMAKLGDAEPRALAVARDGIVYQDIGYDETLMNGLPFIDGVRLVRQGEGFSRLEGMEPVAELLAAALVNTPDLYRSFRVISLARLALDGVLVVRSAEVEAITFGLRASTPFTQQLARLDYILEETRRNSPAGPLKAVNLAVGGNQVPVAFATVRDPLATPSAALTPGSSGNRLFSLPPRNSAPTKRDF